MHFLKKGRMQEMSNIRFRLAATRKITIAFSLAGAAFLGMPQITALAAPVSPQSFVAVPAPAPAADLENSNIQIVQETGCQPQAKGDDVHVSSGQASGHGWWLMGNCTAVKAAVTTQLQEYFSNGSWVDEGTPQTEDVYAGGGSANRSTGRATCTGGTATTGWRSQVTADVIGQSGLSQIYTPAQDIACRV
jgi:hypothetical protein